MNKKLIIKKIISSLIDSLLILIIMIFLAITSGNIFLKLFLNDAVKDVALNDQNVFPVSAFFYFASLIFLFVINIVLWITIKIMPLWKTGRTLGMMLCGIKAENTGTLEKIVLYDIVKDIGIFLIFGLFLDIRRLLVSGENTFPEKIFSIKIDNSN